MTIYGAASDDKIDKLTIFSFQGSFVWLASLSIDDVVLTSALSTCCNAFWSYVTNYLPPGPCKETVKVSKAGRHGILPASVQHSCRTENLGTWGPCHWRFFVWWKSQYSEQVFVKRTLAGFRPTYYAEPGDINYHFPLNHFIYIMTSWTTGLCSPQWASNLDVPFVVSLKNINNQLSCR